MTVINKVLQIIAELPDRKAVFVATELSRRCGTHYDKSYVNRILYGELKHKVICDMHFCWRLREGVIVPSSTDEMSANTQEVTLTGEMDGREAKGGGLYRFMHSKTPLELVTTRQWSEWVETLKSSPERLTRVSAVASKLGLYWPFFLSKKTLNDFLYFSLEDVREIKDLQIGRVILLCIASRALDLLAGVRLNQIVVPPSVNSPLIPRSLSRDEPRESHHLTLHPKVVTQLGSGCKSEKVVKFEDFMRAEEPHALITEEQWDIWIERLKTSPFRLHKIKVVAHMLGLAWPSFSASNTISDYLGFKLNNVAGMKNPYMRKAVLLCICSKALDIIGETKTVTVKSTAWADSLKTKNGRTCSGGETIKIPSTQKVKQETSLSRPLPTEKVKPLETSQMPMVAVETAKEIRRDFVSSVPNFSQTGGSNDSPSFFDRNRKLTDEEIMILLAEIGEKNSPIEVDFSQPVDNIEPLSFKKPTQLGDEEIVSTLDTTVKKPLCYECSDVIVESSESHPIDKVDQELLAATETSSPGVEKEECAEVQKVEILAEPQGELAELADLPVSCEHKFEVAEEDPAENRGGDWGEQVTFDSVEDDDVRTTDVSRDTRPPAPEDAFDGRAFIEPGLSFLAAEQNPGGAKVSWDLIPDDSVLHRTPLEFFDLSTEIESRVIAWLDSLPAEMITPMSGPARLLFASLDLLSVASCTISWVLATCGPSTFDAIFQEISRIVGECSGEDVKIKKESFSGVPFVDCRLLYYLLDRSPSGADGLLEMLQPELREAQVSLMMLSEATICGCGTPSGSAMLRTAQLHKELRVHRMHAVHVFGTSLQPEKFNSLARFLSAWCSVFLEKKGDIMVESLHSGWSGFVPMTSAEIAKHLDLSRQTIYNRLARTQEVLSHKKSVEALQELFYAMFSETLRHGGICATNDLIDGLAERFNWNETTSERLLSDVLKRFGGKCLVLEHGWAAISNRSWASYDEEVARRWELLDEGHPPNYVISDAVADMPEAEVPLVGDEQHVELSFPVALEPQESISPVEQDVATVPAPEIAVPAVHLDQKGQTLDLASLVESPSVWQIAEALLARSEECGLLTAKSMWSIAELHLAPQDYQILLSWGQSATFSSRDLDLRKRGPHGVRSGREALTLVFIAFAAEVARTGASEGEIWPVVYSSLGPSLRDFLMNLQGLNNPSPRPWLKTEMERVFRSYRLRHSFDSAGTHVYVRSIALQFGFTMNSLPRLPWWLCGQQVPVAVEELIGSGPNRSASFMELWNACKELRWKGISLPEFQAGLRGNPWIPPSGIDTVATAVTSRAHLLRQIGDGPVMALSASLLAPPRLVMVDDQPAFKVQLEELWPESYQDRSYVLAFGSQNRVVVDRQPDGGYSLAGGDLMLDPVSPALDVTVISGGQPVLDERLRYALWNEEEEFTFYSASGLKLAESKVQADRSPVFLVCAADIELSAPADRLYTIFSGGARVHHFRKGLPTGFSLSLGGELFWEIPDQAKLKRKNPISASQGKIAGLCLPVNASWGGKARIRLNGLPPGMEPRRLLIGDMRLHIRRSTGQGAESEPFLVPTGVTSLAPRGMLIGLEGGELRRVPVEVVSKFSGIAMESAAGWSVPRPHRVLDKADLQSRRVLAIPHEGSLKEWAYTEGDRFLARPSSSGDSIGQELVGLGAPLYFRKGPYNSTEKPLEISRAVIDSGVLGTAKRIDGGWAVALRQDLDLSDQFRLHAWYPKEPVPVVVEPSHWRHDPQTRSLLVKSERGDVDDPCSISLSFSGTSVGRTWCGNSAFNEIARIVSAATDWRMTASWLAWWHVPVLADEIRQAVALRVRARTADTLIAWMGLVGNEEMPQWMKDVTLKMKAAIRVFFHGELPEPGKCAEILQALGLLSGDWYQDVDEAWERYENLLEISPVVLTHLVKSGTQELYGSKPVRVESLLQRLRCKIAGLPESDSSTTKADIANVEKELLWSASRVMTVDDQFLTRSVLEEARRVLRSEASPVHNLDYCLDIQPVRDWIALRLLS